MKRASWARLQTWLDRLRRDNLLNEGACFAGAVSSPAHISNQLEKSECVQLKGCFSNLLLFLFFPCSPKCWQQSISLHALHFQTARENASRGDLWARLLLGATEPTQGQRQMQCRRYSRKNDQGRWWVHSVGPFNKKHEAGGGGKRLTGQKKRRGWDLCVDVWQRYFIHCLLIMQLESWPLKGSLAAARIRNWCEGCEILRSASLVDCCFLNDGDHFYINT